MTLIRETSAAPAGWGYTGSGLLMPPALGRHRYDRPVGEIGEFFSSVTVETCACGAEAIGWCLLCDESVCEEHAVAIRDHDHLCRDCDEKRRP